MAFPFFPLHNGKRDLCKTYFVPYLYPKPNRASPSICKEALPGALEVQLLAGYAPLFTLGGGLLRIKNEIWRKPDFSRVKKVPTDRCS